MHFDPRDSACKAPFGAIPCGGSVTLSLFPEEGEAFSACTLLLFREFAGLREEIPLSPAAAPDGRRCFTAGYTAPAQPELIWYSFRLETAAGAVFLGKNGLSGDAQPWQQTVYDDSRCTPAWFGRGTTYQIFPDRFCRSRVPDPAEMPGERTVHLNWDEGMDYLPDEKGEIRNRDFFGGDLAGIREKLPYLKELGVSTLYLCPIFTADSNHRYNTGDYEAIDPMLGTEEDFRQLCRQAHALGMRVMLDGVFNHTGSNSRYFNALETYSTLGAAQSKDSPYFSWYTFHSWPEEYDAWWGIKTLPAVNEADPGYRQFIVTGEDSIIRRWLRLGADAWRLDVADELPDDFIADIRTAMEQEKPDSFLLGEVWEDGSNKIAYSRRRQYLLGRETHSLMNYPFRTGALAYLTGGDAADFRESMEILRENYPRPAFYSAMNLLGTHDTPRILTLLGTSGQAPPSTREERFAFRLSPAAYALGRERLELGALLLYAFPGSPTVYYGDEAGMQGFEDPFNRGTYPWGQEDQRLRQRFALLGRIRNENPALQDGEIRWLQAQGRVLAFARETARQRLVAALNAGDAEASLSLLWDSELAVDALTGQQFLAEDGRVRLCLPPRSGVLLR